MDVYRDPRTGDLKAPRFAQTRDRRWGELRLDEYNGTWALVKRNSDGTRAVVRSGRILGELTEARAQEILERIRMKRMR
jgi:hypothetical protein